MLKSLKIENFRSFQSFELQQLGRINLLVGENNSGKTSVLEAVQLFCSRANLSLLNEVITNRGEFLLNDDRRSSSVGRERELDIRHLFYGREISLGSKFLISGDSENSQDSLTGSIVIHESRSNGQSILIDPTDEFAEFRSLDLIIRCNFENEYEEIRLPLSPNDCLPSDYIRYRRNIKGSIVKTQFITPLSLTIREMISLFERIVLKPEEEIVTQALKKIDDSIVRIAPHTSGYTSGNRGGFYVLRSDNNQRVPIGSMGDGIWRMLGLSLAAVCTKGGILLVDEIDTGLHFSTMANMWRMLWRTAKMSNVQVFATTHSRDCWESLAELIESEKVDESEIIIHRIEQGKPHSVVFDSEMIVIAANQGLEVR